MEWAELYLGQRGLGTKYLSEEIDAGIDALDEDVPDVAGAVVAGVEGEL